MLECSSENNSGEQGYSRGVRASLYPLLPGVARRYKDTWGHYPAPFCLLPVAKRLTYQSMVLHIIATPRDFEMLSHSSISSRSRGFIGLIRCRNKMRGARTGAARGGPLVYQATMVT